jgi:fructokinase
MSEKISLHHMICFGEILWDVLPTGAMPGGAPMNVAYHLKKLHHDPKLITRVGHDQWGKELIELMERNEISTEFFQMDHKLETGKVIANLFDSQNVNYEILAPVAWDNILWESSFEKLFTGENCLIYGSLVTRNENSRKTLYQLLELAKTKVLDINLRAPFFQKETIDMLLSRADLLKLNDSELELITGWFAHYDTEEDRIRLLQDRFHIPTIVLTKGRQGCTLAHHGKFYKHHGFEVDVADTIGSGDAFLAGFLSCFFKGISWQSTLEYANALGALVASYSGACPEYKEDEIQLLINRKYQNINVS